jgi:hypothetical protein
MARCNKCSLPIGEQYGMGRCYYDGDHSPVVNKGDGRNFSGSVGGPDDPECRNQDFSEWSIDPSGWKIPEGWRFLVPGEMTDAEDRYRRTSGSPDLSEWCRFGSFGYNGSVYSPTRFVPIIRKINVSSDGGV